MKKDLGITLVALVITIIILLILASITISLTLGENGLLKRVSDSKEVSNLEAAREIVNMAIGAVHVDAWTTSVDKNDIRERLENEIKGISKEDATVTIGEDIFIADFRGYIFNISDDFRRIEFVQEFDTKEWDKQKTPDDVFIWASENPADGENYHTIIGYKDEMTSYPVLRVPSRCHVIDVQYGAVASSGRFETEPGAMNRLTRFNDLYYVPDFLKNLEKMSIPGNTKVELPATITRLTGAFYGFATIKEVNLPNSIKTIDGGSFCGCTEIKEINLPNNLETLGDYAFYRCENLEKVNIPNTITKVGTDAIKETKWFSTLPDGEFYIGSILYNYKGQVEGEVKIKDGTKAIASRVFTNKNLTSVVLPNSLKEIGENAFYMCSNLQNITLPSSVESVRTSAFSKCSSLTSVNALGNLKLIGESAFQECTNLENVNISNIEDIKKDAFDKTKWLEAQANSAVYIGNLLYKYNSKDANVIVRDGTTKICAKAFASVKDSIIEVSLPNSIKEIGELAFYECKNLRNVNTLDSVEVIRNSAFSLCSNLELQSLPNSIKKIEESAFYGCSKCFQNLNLPEGLKSIGNRAFLGCDLIQNVTTPSSLEIICADAFRECANLKSVKINEGTRILLDGVFWKCEKLEEVELPSTLHFVGGGIFMKSNNVKTIKINKEKDTLEGILSEADCTPSILWKGSY